MAQTINSLPSKSLTYGRTIIKSPSCLPLGMPVLMNLYAPHKESSIPSGSAQSKRMVVSGISLMSYHVDSQSQMCRM